jgi:hypothetical protein
MRVVDSRSLCYRVRLDLKRVQSFLFEVPRLRAMVGANVLLGEFVRFELTAAYLKKQSAPPRCLRDLPTANLQIKEDPLDAALQEWSNLPAPTLQSNVDERFGQGFSVWLNDDPAKAYQRGLLAREGGHFVCLFDERETAKSFADEAAVLAGSFLPGLRLETQIFAFQGDENVGAWKRIDSEGELPASPEIHCFDIPILERCPEIPSQLATSQTEMWSGESFAKARVSMPVALRYRYGKRYVRHEQVPFDELAVENAVSEQFFTLDPASLIRPTLPMWLSNRRESATYPQDFAQLAGNGYMAVIHIDGNGLGERSRSSREKAAKATSFRDWISAEFEIESIYYESRVTLRKALSSSLGDIFQEHTAWKIKGKRVRPYQLLMLGGDDLLLVCRADKALPFAVKFCEQLSKASEATENFKQHALTVGVGVVISQTSVPFHHLHSQAETLAAGAKQLHRFISDSKKVQASVVDWLVTTSSFGEDPYQARRKHSLVAHEDAKLILSRKPYVVLKSQNCDDGISQRSLEWLIDSTQKVSGDSGTADDAARSQLKGLTEKLKMGKTLGQLAWLELPEATRKSLIKAGFDGTSPWIESADKKVTSTSVYDFVELMEIAHLGRQSRAGSQSVGGKASPKDVAKT